MRIYNEAESESLSGSQELGQRVREGEITTRRVRQEFRCRMQIKFLIRRKNVMGKDLSCLLLLEEF